MMHLLSFLDFAAKANYDYEVILVHTYETADTLPAYRSFCPPGRQVTMKRLSATQLALSYTGVFLGAGFVSGQELWQFFSCFGPVGLLGFLGTAALFFCVDYSLLRLIMVTGQEDMARMLTPGDHPRLRVLVSVMQGLLLFGVCVIMIAGGAVLLYRPLGIPLWLAGLIFTTAVFLVARFGLHGVVTTFSLVVPVITVCAVLLGIITLFQSGFRFAPATGSVSALIPNWVVGFFTYAAYNLFGTICVLAPMAKHLPDLATLHRGLCLGNALLILLAGSIIAALAAKPDAGLAELPMALLAGQLHPGLESGYDLLMGLGMFSSALSSSGAVINQLSLSWDWANKWRKLATALLLTLAWLLSLVGFGNLIGVIYPVFGYAGIPFLVFLVRNWLHTRKEKHLL